MSAELDRLLEPPVLAARAWRWSGDTPLEQWPRLAALDAAGQGADRRVRVTLSWDEDEHGVALLEGEVTARLGALCQRCLEGMELELRARPRLFFGSPAQLEASIAGHGHEAYEAEAGLTLRQLLEDELLLVMPAFPVHERTEDCGALARTLAQLAPACDEQGSGSSPFAALAELKRKN